MVPQCYEVVMSVSIRSPAILSPVHYASRLVLFCNVKRAVHSVYGACLW